MSVQSKKDRKAIKRLLKIVVNRGLDDLYFFDFKEEIYDKKKCFYQNSRYRTSNYSS